RTVADAALFLDAVVGRDPLDPDSLPHPGYSYLDRLDEAPAQGRLRVGYSATLGYGRAQKDVLREVESAAAALGAALGVPIEPIDDVLTDVGLPWVMLNVFERRAWLIDLLEPHRGDWEHGFLQGLDFAANVTPREIGWAQREREKLVEEVARIFARYD